jgi:hypothetical protein
MFNFGAMLGGAAEQIVADIDEKEKEVKLRTRTILDRQVQESYANRKEYKANKKKVQEQLNSIVSYFGDDPDRWNKARAIVAGGDAHVGKMSTIFERAQSNKQNVNEIYGLAKTDKDSTLTNIEDATNSLVQMAQIATPDFGTSKQTSTLFGQTDMGTVYSKARKEFEQSGLLDAIPTATESGATYGSGKLNIANLTQDAKPIAQQKANILRDLTKYKEGTPEHTAALQKQSTLNSFEEKNSLALKIAQEQNKTKGTATRGFYQTTLKNGLASVESRLKGDVITGDDGKIIEGLEEREAYKKKKILDYKSSFVQDLIRNPGGISQNGLDVIQADPELNDIYKNIMKKEQDRITGGDGETSVPNTPKAKAQKLVKDNPNLSLDVLVGLKEINKGMTKVQLHKFILNAYPKPSDMSDEDYNDNIKNLVGETFKNFENNEAIKKKKDSSIDNLYGEKKDSPKRILDKKGNAPSRNNIVKGFGFVTTDEEQKKLDEWDSLYGKDFNPNGTPKQVKKT